MAPVLDLTVTLTIILLSAVAGWWLRTTTAPSRRSPETPDEPAKARRVLARLQQLVALLVRDLGEHAGRLARIQKEIESLPPDRGGDARGAAARLVEASRTVQDDLRLAAARLAGQWGELGGPPTDDRTDAQTGLPGPAALAEELDRTVVKSRGAGRPVSVVLVDVDQLRQAGNRQGREAEDEILRNVTGVLRRSMPALGVLARRGPEQFAAVLPDTSGEQAALAAERVRRDLEAADCRIDGKHLAVTGSFGVVELAEGEDAAALLERAGAALAVSKRAGRNCVHWHDGRYVRRAKPEHEADAEAAQPAPPLPSAAEETGEEPAGTARGASAASEPKRDSALLNRTSFCQQVRRHVAACRENGGTVSVVMIEVDDFDGIADRFGRRGGSMVLEATGRFVTAVARSRDAAARYGPTSFAMLLVGMDQSRATALTEQLRQAVARCALPVGDRKLRFTVSAGVAELGRSDSFVQLLERAEDGVREGSRSDAEEPDRKGQLAVAAQL